MTKQESITALAYRSGLKKYYEMMEREVQLEKQDHDHVRHQGEDPQQQQQGSSQDSIDSKSKRKISGPTSAKTRATFISPNYASPDPGEGSGFFLSQQSLTVALLVILVTLCMITLALFKLASAIAALSDRLGTIEHLLERYTLICLDPSSKFCHQ
jgi:hypothetical protein